MRNCCFCASYTLLAALYAGFPALSFGADPALTIYNQNFAVIRETLPLDLKAGDTVVHFSGTTAQVEPDSVILRDPTGAHALRVVEQNYRNDPISQDRLLNLFEGKTIEFAAGNNPDGSTRIVTGKIVRSGYVPHYQAMNRYGPQYTANQYAMVSGGAGQPVIEVDGKLKFSLPGLPIFPSLGDDTILEPTLDWILHSDRAARFEAELSYVSGGLTWSSDYNIVAPETGDTLELVGWVTLDNQSGKVFDHAHIKLMAGDVNKLQPAPVYRGGVGGALADSAGAPQVTERAFEDYHLYTLPQPTTLRDRETKQVEFLRASGIQSKRLYVYDGMASDQRWGNQDLRSIQQYGTVSNPHVWVMREFVNSAANHLGMPLPKGRLRFYRRDQDGQMEFTGEDQIDHTPKDETVRLYTGNAFDITGERRQTHFQSQSQYPGFTDESFEIKVRNHKTEAVTVQVVEHLYRWATWAIKQESAAHRQIDSKTIAYDVTLQPGEEKVITYTAHYTW
jgi:hypothetical protein